MNYKDKFYSKYVSSHTKELYGDFSIEKIKSQFPVWKSYFSTLLFRDKKAKILDIGCGNGSFLFWLKSMGFKNFEGVDISQEQINLGKKIGIENIFCVDFRDYLKGKNNSYDLIFTRDLLEHFEKGEVVEILELIFSSLAPNGKFIIQTVNAENLLWGRLRHSDFTHDFAFTESSIKQALFVCGFENINVYPQRPVSHGLISFFRSVLWRIIELFLKFYLLIEVGSAKGIFTQNIIIFAKKQ